MLLDLFASMGGTDWPHELGDVLDRPNGFAEHGEYLFLRFRTPMQVLTAHGMEKCKAGTCLIYSPDHPQWYQGDGVGFRDDWCHVGGRHVKARLEQAGLPLNTLFQARNVNSLPLLIEEIRTELQRKEGLWEEAVALTVAKVILLLGRGLQEAEARDAGVDVAQRKRLGRVREHVHERLAQHWTVAQMAKLAKLGENRFAVLYRETFEVSPMEDLIQARLNHAQRLLTIRHVTVSEAAQRSGFGSIHYFSRLFRRRVGCAPSDYCRAPRA
jgi:AraC-like DNA-binding protein